MGKLPLQFHPHARNEAVAAYDWYAGRSPEVADSFRQELEVAGAAIQRAPLRWAKYQFGTRRYLMKRFPFVVVYRQVAKRIEIVAVAHGHRKPGYWKARLEPE